mmetsp:Transcript_41312/g.89444  ORF Transcript_41312/g.89444 Transcript_41312/m.89444 type:complete len:154 (-) Transcript_41312:291-752(-)
MDAKGCGRSAGTRAFVRNFEHLVRSYVTYFSKIKEEFPGKKAVLMGESMGGAIAIQIHRQVRCQLNVIPTCAAPRAGRGWGHFGCPDVPHRRRNPPTRVRYLRLSSPGEVGAHSSHHSLRRYSCPLLLGPCPLWLVQSESLFLQWQAKVADRQ